MKIKKVAILFDESRSFKIFSQVFQEMGLEVMKLIPCGIKEKLNLQDQLKKIKEELNSFKPDLIIAWQWDILTLTRRNTNAFESLKRFLSSSNIKKTIIMQEDPIFYHTKELRELTCSFEYLFTHSMNFEKEYLKSGVEKVFYRPCYYASKEFKKPDEKREYQYDIAFIGSMRKRRKEFFEKIKITFPNLKMFIGSELDKKKSAEIFFNSKINLIYSMASDTEECKGHGYPMKLLEVMACNGFALTEKRKHVENDFVIGEDLDIFESFEECIKKVEYYLKHEKEREEINNKGYQKVINYFKDTDGAKKMIETLEQYS